MGRPRKKNPVTYGQVKVLYDQGMSTCAIAKQLGCSEYLVESRLNKQDIKWNAHITHTERTPRLPITLEEISRYREGLPVGAAVRLSVSENDEDFRRVRTEKKHIVIEKYQWIFRAKDAQGRIRTMTYKEMLVKERPKMLQCEKQV